MRLKTLRPQLATLGSSLKTVNPDSWRSGKTSAQRGYGYRWQQYRLRYLESNPLCCYCEAKGLTVAASVVDHKTPHQGNEALFWDEDNHQPLCKPCHDGQKAREEQEARKGQ